MTNNTNKLTNTRWLVLIGGLIVPFCLGAIYGWSVFIQPLQSNPYNYSATQAYSIMSVTLAVGSFAMTIGGYFQDRLGPKAMSILSGFMLGVGYLIAYLGKGNYWSSLIGIGGLVGLSIAFGYIGPIAACTKWYPDKRGAITGLSAAGFGISALLFSKLAGYWLKLGIPAHEIWLYFGGICFIGVIISSMFISNPPKDWFPAGWIPPILAQSPVELSRRQIIQTARFWKLWFIFVLAAAAGMMAIGTVKPFSTEILESKNINTILIAAFSTALIGWISIANGSGRLLWGWISDRFGREKVILVMFVIQAILLLSLGLGWKPSMTYELALIYCLIGFCYGGTFGTFPALTAKYFGIKHFGANYGLVFTGCGFGALIGPFLAGILKDLTGRYEVTYRCCGVFMVIGVFVVINMYYSRNVKSYTRKMPLTE